MAGPYVTNTLVANVTTTEISTGNVVINRSTGNPAFNSTLGEFSQYVTLQAGDNPINPISGFVYQLYVKNIDPAGTITVKWTPQGGAAVTILVLYPGDMIIFWQSPGSATGGVSAMKLTPSVANVLCEFFIGQ